ncbi:putative ABC transporter ATP-binding protein [Ensifer psoraleae]|uniref:dipeptide ABC transporter ATP-binding protein n=1 Tax=Sinorhizobium psoraleae TaxID=520838 RepID=UPI001FEA70F5|nr:ABC transporter ATP-binding protein [Sinorhizobium psoraleae]NRP75634.1 putative ABC transporter ATP-binding protein [Sinorhizobium psoraleae]
MMKPLNSSPLLEVKDLTVTFSTSTERVKGVEKINLQIHDGETLGIVGESGSGKSVTAYAMMGLLARNGRIDSGEVRFAGQAICSDPRALASVRGKEVGFIFQNPRAALNPLIRVGDQILDAVLMSKRPPATKKEARARVIELLEMVRIDRAMERSRAYPHELSGGMCQRILIAMALASEPRLLIADEPTTGLDVTTQKVIMDTLRDLASSRGLATLLITHDLGLAAEYCSRLMVMSQGHVVEEGDTLAVLARPRQPYTQRLVAATPRIGKELKDLLPPGQQPPPTVAPDQGRQVETPALNLRLLQVEGLRKSFGTRSQHRQSWLPRWARRGNDVCDGQREQADALIHAVRDVSFHLEEGEAIGIVGESGSGKTTTSRMVARLLDQSTGSIVFMGQDIGKQSSRSFTSSPMRREIQVVFQDPLGSLNPRFTAYDSIRNPLRNCTQSLNGGELSRDSEHEQILAAAQQAGLAPELLSRFPHQLSGGQQARVGIARALVVRPKLLILDEPTSALDVSVQAVVLNQLDALRRALNLTVIFVSHDLNVVRLMCDRVLVMRHGSVVESGTTENVFTSPSHAYTRELLAAIPHLKIMQEVDHGQNSAARKTGAFE